MAGREREERAWLAIDLGAGSGRLILGRLQGERLVLEEVHRFRHEQVRANGRLRWSFEAMWKGIHAGLARLRSIEGLDPSRIASIGVDSWGVDYGLLDARGALIEDPVSYRDPRTEGMLERLFERVPRAEIYRRTGIQFLPFNTLVQLFAQIELGEWPREAARLLLVPDLVHRRLCGSERCERTDASTTQMLSLGTREWDRELARAIGLDPAVLPELIDAPAALGTLDRALARELGLPELPIVAPATHDTASAIAGTALQPGWAYISSGTWSLVGLELERPIATEAALDLNVTNEGGVAGTTRLLKNVMGLWILERCRESWKKRGLDASWDSLLAGLDPADLGEPFLDPDDLRFLAPADMEAEVQVALCSRYAAPDLSPRALTRAILVSLARRYAEVVQQLEILAARPIAGVHVVGGGSQNAFLNQATANACRRPVLAGPVEATAIGNLLVQALADGSFPDLTAARAFLSRSMAPVRYDPN
jgi:rhamnulokinase